MRFWAERLDEYLEPAPEPARSLSLTRSLFGGGTLVGQLSPAAFATVASALDAWLQDPDPAAAPYRRSFGERMADSLDDMAAFALTHDPDHDDDSGDDETFDTDDPAGERTGRPDDACHPAGERTACWGMPGEPAGQAGGTGDPAADAPARSGCRNQPAALGRRTVMCPLRKTALGVALLLAACSGDDSTADSTSTSNADAPAQGADVLTIEEAQRAPDGSLVAVEGYLVADPDPHLCFGLLESFPPQCGSPSLRLSDARSALDDVLDDAPQGDAIGASDATVRWLNEPVVVNGVKGTDVIEVDSVVVE